MKLKKLKTFSCRIDNFFDGEPLESNHVAVSRSQARYLFWSEHEESLLSFKACFKFIKIRTIGNVHPSHFFSDLERFNSMIQRRSIPFAYQGMIVEVAGRKGWIVGGNNHLNLDVLFEGEGHISNCHPHYETVYYDQNNNIIKSFKKEAA